MGYDQILIRYRTTESTGFDGKNKRLYRLLLTRQSKIVEDMDDSIIVKLS